MQSPNPTPLDNVLPDEEMNINYEPCDEEIQEYAEYLGIDLEEDKDLLYIARDGLRAPLPEPWKACRTQEGEIYYYNTDTSLSRWEHPLDEFYRKQYQTLKAQKSQRKEKKDEQKFQRQLQKQSRTSSAAPSQTNSHQNSANALPILSQINQSKSFGNDSSMLSYSSCTGTNNQTQIQCGSNNASANVSANNKNLKMNDSLVNNGSPLVQFNESPNVNTIMLSSPNVNTITISSPMLSHQKGKENLFTVSNKSGGNESMDLMELGMELDSKIKLDEVKKAEITLDTEFENKMRATQEILVVNFDEFMRAKEDDYERDRQTLITKYEDIMEQYQTELEDQYDESFSTVDVQSEKNRIQLQLEADTEDIIMNAKTEIIAQEQQEKAKLETEEAQLLSKLQEEIVSEVESAMVDKLNELQEQINKTKLNKQEKQLKLNALEREDQELQSTLKTLAQEKEELNTVFKANIETLTRQLEAEKDVTLNDYTDELENLLSQKQNYMTKHEENMKARSQQLREQFRKNLDQDFLEMKQKFESDESREENDFEAQQFQKLEQQLKRQLTEDSDEKLATKMAALEQERNETVQKLEKQMQLEKEQLENNQEQMRKNFEESRVFQLNKLKNDIANLASCASEQEQKISQINRETTSFQSLENNAKEKFENLLELENEISSIKTNISQAKEEYEEVNGRLHQCKEQLKNRNDLLVKVEEMHHHLDAMEKDVETERQKTVEIERAINANLSRVLNETFHNQFSNASIGVAKILKEVEEIKFKIKKDSEKKSLSTGRLCTKTLNISSTNNDSVNQRRTICNGGDSDEDELMPRDFLEQNFKSERQGAFRQNRKFRVPIKPQHPSSYQPENYGKPKVVNGFDILFEKWKRIALEERERLNNFWAIIKTKKLKVKTVQDEIKNEQNQYKLEYNKCKELPVISNATKIKLETVKKSLNLKIKQFNDDLYSLKEEEKQMKAKDAQLASMESYLTNCFENKHLSEMELENLYNKYKEIQIDGLQSEYNTLESLETFETKETSRFQPVIQTESTIERKDSSERITPKAGYHTRNRHFEPLMNNENDRSMINRNAQMEIVETAVKNRSKSNNFNNSGPQQKLMDKSYEQNFVDELLMMRHPNTTKHSTNNTRFDPKILSSREMVTVMKRFNSCNRNLNFKAI
jgi:hypothetical protein